MEASLTQVGVDLYLHLTVLQRLTLLQAQEYNLHLNSGDISNSLRRERIKWKNFSTNWKNAKNPPKPAPVPPHLRITSCLFQPFSKVPPSPFPPPLFSTLLYIQSFTMICGKFLLPLCYDTSIRSPEEGFKNEIVLTAQTNGLSAWPLSLIFVTYHRHLVTDKRNTQIQIHLYKYTNTHTYKCTSYPPSLVCRFTGLW